jgi:hypothetical protein
VLYRIRLQPVNACGENSWFCKRIYVAIDNMGHGTAEGNVRRQRLSGIKLTEYSHVFHVTSVTVVCLPLGALQFLNSLAPTHNDDVLF